MTESETFSLMTPLAVATAVITLTVVIHMLGLTALMATMQSRSRHIKPTQSLHRQGVFVVLVVMGLVLIHGIEIWLYAFVYLLLGAVGTVEEALYFSATTFTTLGYGDVILESRWRLVAALEGVNGFLLLGWSTAFLVSVISRLRSAELEWIDRLGED
ncbi:MAG: K+ channel TrkA-N [Maricaulis sp.]|jgi:voltage-gated potassium channel Kch|nr:K+ channel TrkA-N [Maricaulis sp.]HAQ34314.1 K+ channel TrkA-N [Alphaproteobacteria bacterium]|tara:strand:- start:543 stop:1016 length:474 start_codon:yes stop_codon:yes gene_type:complete